MTRNVSKPSAAVTASLRRAAASKVGSQRDSRVSVRRKTMSCCCTSSSSASASARTPSTSAAPTGWPGIGIPITTPRASAPGKMRRNSSAAAGAFFVFPPMQSLWAKSDWRTGFEYETLPESTSVIALTPQPRRQRATAQPSVPAPMSKHLCAATFSGSSAGMSRHRMSRMLRSTAAAAVAAGSICADRSISRAPGRPDEFFSHPTAEGGAAVPPPPPPPGVTSAEVVEPMSHAVRHSEIDAASRSKRRASSCRMSRMCSAPIETTSATRPRRV
mmetsp:Transcript_34364/g.110608  ORF Transcript_34364/g.110608 Transcript_34364/m.110608 type:complete len:274 (+) Transcript_34364:940-1761(+)